MAKVQVYNERQVQADPFRPVFQQDVTGNPNEFEGMKNQATAAMSQAVAGEGQALAGLGRSIEGAADVAARIAQAEQHKVTQANVMQATSAFEDELREKQYGENGWMKRQGANATSLLPEMQRDFQEIEKKHRELLGTDERGLTAWSKIISQKRDAVLDAGARHQASQVNKYRDDASQALILSSTNSAIDNPLDDKIVAGSVDMVRKTVFAMGKANGSPPEAIEETMKSAVSAIHLGRIQRLAQDAAGSAEGMTAAIRLHESVAKQLHGNDHIRADQLLKGPRQQLADNSELQRLKGAPDTNAVQLGNAVSAGLRGEYKFDPSTVNERMHATIQKFGDLEVAAIATLLNSDAKAEQYLRNGRDLSKITRDPDTLRADLETVIGRRADQRGNGPGAGQGRPSIRTEIEAGGLPPAGKRLTPQSFAEIKPEFYKASDFMDPREGGQFVDARAAKMADMLGKRFFDATGIKVPINEEHGFTPGDAASPSGKRRGTSLPGTHAPNSQHHHGRAFDFQIQKLTPDQKALFLKTAREIGFTGVGFYENSSKHLHLDTATARSWGGMPTWAGAGMAVTPTLATPSIAVADNRGLPDPFAAGANAATSAPRIAPSGPQTVGRMPFTDADRYSVTAALAAQDPIAGLRGGEIGGGASAVANMLPEQVSTIVKPGRLDAEAMRARLEEVADPLQRERLRPRIEAEITRQAKLEKEDLKEVLNKEIMRVRQGGGVYDMAPEHLQALSEGNPQAFGTLERIEKARVEGRKTRTDPAVYAHFSKMASREPDAFIDTNLVEFSDRLSESDFQELVRKQNAVAEKGIEASKNYTGLQTVQQVKTQALAGAGLSDDSKSPGDVQRIGMFHAAVDREVSAFKAEHSGKHPTGQDLQGIMQRLLTPVGDQGGMWVTGWGSTRKYLFEMGTPEENQLRREMRQNPVGELERFSGVTKDNLFERVPEKDLRAFSANYQKDKGKMPAPEVVASYYNDALAIMRTGRELAPESDEVRGEVIKDLIAAGIAKPTERHIQRAYSGKVRRLFTPPAAEVQF